MPRTQTIVQLSDDLVEALDAEAARRRTSRSAVIRESIVAFLGAQGRAGVTQAIVDGYRRVPQGVPDEWGDLERQVDRATKESLQRLDAEEQGQGLEPW